MLVLTGNSEMIESMSIERKAKYNYHDGNNKNNKKKITSASDLYDSDEEIAQKYDNSETSKRSMLHLTNETAVDAIRDTERLSRTINNILANPKNWMISEINKESYEVVKVELKPLDISTYCKSIFEKCSKTLIMSATILNCRAFCRSIGLDREDDDHHLVKFIQIKSDLHISSKCCISKL